MFVGGVAQPWGAEIALLRLIEGLQNTAQVTVVLLEDGPMVTRYREAGARVEVLALPVHALESGRQLGTRKPQAAHQLPRRHASPPPTDPPGPIPTWSQGTP